MNPSQIGPMAAGAANAARRLFRRPRVVMSAVALATVGLATPTAYFAFSAGQNTPDVAAAASADEAAPARTPEKPATTAAVVETPAAQTITAELEPAAARAPRVTAIPPARAVQTTRITAEKLDILSDTDPRWGGGSTTVEPVEAAELRSQLEELKQPAAETPAAEIIETAAAPETRVDETDAAPTGAIAAAAFVQPRPAPRVPAATAPRQNVVQDTAPEAAPAKIAAIPPSSTPRTEGGAVPVQQAAVEKAAPAAGGARMGRINTFVNMRAAPENEAAVVTVVPEGAQVGVAAGCKHWCQVTYEGRRGYVYKSFISGT